MFKKYIAVIVCVSMLIANPAFSATFGKSSSTSRPSTSSTTRSSSSQNSTTSPQSSNTTKSGSLSQGQSVGMTRTDVTQSVRDGSYKQPATVTPTQVPSNNNYANQNSGYQNPPSTGYGMGTVLGAAAVAGMVGYMLHRDNNGNSYYTNPNSPNIAYDSNGNRMSGIPQGNYANQGTLGSNGQINSSGSSSNNWLIFLLLLLLLGGLAYYFFSRNKLLFANSGHSPNNSIFVPAVFASTSQPRNQLEDNAQQMFINFQKNNRPSQINAIEAQSEPVFFDAIKSSVMGASDSKEVTIKSIEAEIVDVSEKGSKLIGSVRYRAVVHEVNGQTLSKITLDEVWHYIYSNNHWLLAGIEPVIDESVETEKIQNNKPYKI